jgi:ATP-dependent Lhr-like helicase
LLIANALTRLWSEGWVESVKPPALPWNVCAQQALLITIENGLLPRSELLEKLRRCIPELPTNGLEEVLDTLLGRNFLCNAAEGVVQIGPTAESEFGKTHYRDLLATFSGSDLVLGRYGTHDIGYLDPVVISGEKEDRLVLLGGRSWLVTSVDFSKRVATLEPSEHKGEAHWLGGGAVVGRDVALSVAKSLKEEPTQSVQLSRRARARLDELVVAMPAADGRYILQELSVDKWRVWTYLGTLANRTLLAAYRTQGATKSSAWWVEFKKRPPQTLGQAAIRETDVVTDPSIFALTEAINFHEMISERQATLEVLGRCFEPVG